nr:MAG TPA: hypothetical protein [Herelleviridae sp.]
MRINISFLKKNEREMKISRFFLASSIFSPYLCQR